MNRPTWDEYFLEIAKVVASRSTCPRAEVGAVITKQDRIIATGYNGSPAGELHCIDAGCNMIDGHCERTIHAETNAIGYAARFGVALEGATLYVYDEMGREGPCHDCMKVIKAAGIGSIIMRGDKE